MVFSVYQYLFYNNTQIRLQLISFFFFDPGLSKGSLISLTSSRSTSINVMAPNSGPPSGSSMTCNFFFFFEKCLCNFNLNCQIFLAILSITNENRPPLTSARPKCNSILHMFGEWLFEAAHIGSEMWLQTLKSKFYSMKCSQRDFIFFPLFYIQSKQLKLVAVHHQ